MDRQEDPFVSRGFLGSAERTGAAGPDLGWQARHIVLKQNDLVVGILPTYVRHHSFGDFSRDWNWPQAWARAGIDYYPKLVSGIPYTPSPGPRLLVRKGIERLTVAPRLVEGALALANTMGASCWQCLFVDDGDRDLLRDSGAILRRGIQFHWTNRGYRDFDDYLSGFVAAKRKKIKRDRRDARDSGLRFEARHGDEMSPSLWDTAFRHYRNTFLRYGNHPAFSREFFTAASAALKRQMVVFMAFDNADPVASAICYRDSSTLYGRHWGTDLDMHGLHFELCYYQGIDYCIRHGIDRFEPGAQGEHKIARGFEPSPTWSAFWIADRQMRKAVGDFVTREDAAMQDYAAETQARLPFRTPSP